MESQAVLSFVVWALAMELGSSGRTVHALNHSTTCPSPYQDYSCSLTLPCVLCQQISTFHRRSNPWVDLRSTALNSTSVTGENQHLRRIVSSEPPRQVFHISPFYIPSHKGLSSPSWISSLVLPIFVLF